MWQNIKKIVGIASMYYSFIFFSTFSFGFQIHVEHVEQFLNGKGLLQNDVLQGK